MKTPTKKLFSFTWVGWLNVILLQWLFVRLAYNDKGRWFLFLGIVPLTGWSNDYKYIL